MKPLLPPFKLERFFAQYEFKVKYLLSASDCESLSMRELLTLADTDSLMRWENLGLGYTESMGLPALREEVVNMYPGLTVDDCMILTPEEGIYIAMNTLLAPGDHVIAIAPAYQSLYEIARSRGCEVTPWRIQPSKTGWRLDIDALERSVNERTRLLVINFPHNPTGYLPSQVELQAIVDVATRHNLYIFSDEMYRYLEYEPVQRLAPVCAMYEKGISLSGMSKAFALPGLRIGWLATRDADAMRRWRVYKDYTTICNSAPSEILALMALRARDTIVARNLGIIRSNIAEMGRFCNDFTHLFYWRPPRAGSIAFAEWMGSGNVDEFCKAVLDQQEVMIVPGNTFDVAGNYFRIGLGRRNFPTAIGRLRSYLLNVSQD
jgi:aspartate/methionine/tyrosine aminotransferase